ncbi:MAG: hypothetical protein H6721_14335 [Sandaracinus sp.]|nr:hypothetical protein [Myxococcales bacterium]MCB9599382.1 hypothetical protein [Sandaracinus sp.]MCB9611310.1 hypothetical protein [Sandaracinus sp.]MCB9621327.1 hypothetical protein [Sandaracinus sp.]MCB9633294.1 hypothetical protein [Sandaracinus sp.]
MGRRSWACIGMLALVLTSGVVHAQPSHPSEDAFPHGALHLEHESRLSLPTWVTWTGLAATAALGTSMVWSFSKLSDARRLHDAAPSPQTRDALDRRRRQTLGLGLGTGLAAIGTTLIAILATDWGGPEVGGWATREGGGLSIAGAF